jgi:TonB family protein
MRGRQEGRVFVEALVMPDGTVAGARVVPGLEPRLGLEEEAVKATRRWLFKAGTLDGRPVPVIVTVEMAFRLK